MLPSLFLILHISACAMMSYRARNDVYVDVSINDNKNEGWTKPLCEICDVTCSTLSDRPELTRVLARRRKAFYAICGAVIGITSRSFSHLSLMRTSSLTTFCFVLHKMRQTCAHLQLISRLYKNVQRKWKAIPRIILEYCISLIRLKDNIT